MLDPNLIRQNPDKVRQNTQERGNNPTLVDQWLEADKRRIMALQNLEGLNRQKNELAEMGKTGADVNALREKGKLLKDQQKELQEAVDLAEQEWKTLISQIPNIHLPDVAIGNGEKDNIEVHKVGTVPTFDFPVKDHTQLGKDLDMLDFDTGAKVTGSQFYFLKNAAVELEFALIQFGLNFFKEKGYTLVMTPDLAKSRYYLGTGYAPRGDEAQIYEINGEDLGLIATAEVTMAGMFADEVLDAEKLPMKFAAISHCFRKEAGAYGKFSKGLYRVHQFSKLEMFAYCTPENSEALHEELLAMEEEIVQKLGLAYRVVKMCSGDLGAMAAKKYDLEAWMPSRGDYGEITSTSNCTDFQARNLNVRYRTKEGKIEYVHMLNGTAIVLSRFPLAIMENYQQADGSIRIPDVLQKYMGRDVITR